MNTNTKTILGWALIIGPILFHIFFGIFYGDTDPTIATSEEFLKQASDNILLSKILVVGGNATMVFVAGALFVFASFLASNSHSPAYGLFSAFFFLILGANVIESGATELTALEFYDQGNINQAVDVFNAAELIVKVKEPSFEEVELLKDKTIFTYLHLSSCKELTKK